jgi:hypothetical protein
MKDFIRSLFDGAKNVAKALDYKSIIIPGVLVSMELLMFAIKRYGHKNNVECEPTKTTDVLKSLK